MSEEKSEIGTASKEEIIIPDQIRESLGLHPRQEVRQEVLRDAMREMIAREKEKRATPDQQEVAVALVLEPRRTAIVVIDLQKGIAQMPGGAPHTKPAVIANSARLLTAARAAGAQPILVHVGGSPDGADRLHTPTDQPMRSFGQLPPDWSEAASAQLQVEISAVERAPLTLQDDNVAGLAVELGNQLAPIGW